MPQVQTHLVNRCRLELDFEDRRDAEPVSAALMAAFKDQVAVVMEEVCEALVPPDTYITFDELDLELGEIDPMHPIDDLVVKFRESLELRLAALLGQQPQRSPEQRAKSLVDDYLLTGQYPWWAGTPAPERLQAAMETLLSHPSGGEWLSRRLRQGGNPVARLVTGLPPGLVVQAWECLVAQMPPYPAQATIEAATRRAFMAQRVSRSGWTGFAERAIQFHLNTSPSARKWGEFTEQVAAAAKAWEASSQPNLGDGFEALLWWMLHVAEVPRDVLAEVAIGSLTRGKDASGDGRQSSASGRQGGKPGSQGPQVAFVEWWRNQWGWTAEQAKELEAGLRINWEISPRRNSAEARAEGGLRNVEALASDSKGHSSKSKVARGTTMDGSGDSDIQEEEGSHSETSPSTSTLQAILPWLRRILRQPKAGFLALILELTRIYQAESGAETIEIEGLTAWMEARLPLQAAARADLAEVMFRQRQRMEEMARESELAEDGNAQEAHQAEAQVEEVGNGHEASRDGSNVGEIGNEPQVHQAEAQVEEDGKAQEVHQAEAAASDLEEAAASDVENVPSNEAEAAAANEVEEAAANPFKENESSEGTTNAFEEYPNSPTEFPADQKNSRPSVQRLFSPLMEHLYGLQKALNLPHSGLQAILEALLEKMMAYETDVTMDSEGIANWLQQRYPLAAAVRSALANELVHLALVKIKAASRTASSNSDALSENTLNPKEILAPSSPKSGGSGPSVERLTPAKDEATDAISNALQQAKTHLSWLQRTVGNSGSKIEELLSGLWEMFAKDNEVADANSESINNWLRQNYPLQPAARQVIADALLAICKPSLQAAEPEAHDNSTATKPEEQEIEQPPVKAATQPPKPKLPTQTAIAWLRKHLRRPDAGFATLIAQLLSQYLQEYPGASTNLLAMETWIKGLHHPPKQHVPILAQALVDAVETQPRPSPKPRSKAEPEKSIWIDNAGLILFSPFLQRYLQYAGLVEDKAWLSNEARHHGVRLLQSMVDPSGAWNEASLALPKLLCGLQPDAIVDPYVPLPEELRGQDAALIEVALSHWTAAGKIGVEGFRAAWLARHASLRIRDDHWLLRVEAMGHDMLLEMLPWDIAYISLPWMPAMIYVDWGEKAKFNAI